MANKKSTTKKSVKKEYPTYAELVGQAATVEGVEGHVESLGEYDDNGTPHSATFKHRREVTLEVVDPEDVELLGSTAGFDGGY